MQRREGKQIERLEQQLFRPQCEAGEYKNEFIVCAELLRIQKDKVIVDSDSVRYVLNHENTNEVEREESNEGTEFISHFSENKYRSQRREFQLSKE
ncbi:MAG: hypothetical protein EZS28_005276 [Streblomastix strix]|uniref:Uncharacterized protein n=1 Tax=Streblomastix strix TaxID=222440 RepID=A0A5J4WW09_9EUKA|nr:MAG: hypothetical protein EZS28_005276 [Streblomastix strix]